MKTDRRTPANRAGAAAVPPNNRSRIGNGSILPAGVDGRSGPARRWKELFREFTARTGGQHEQLCRSLASLILQREALDAKIAAGEDAPTDELLRLASEVRRTLTRLGIDEESSYDGTQDAIAALRAGREEARP